MRKLLSSFIGWVIIVTLTAVVCLTAGVALIFLFECFNLGISVFFFGTILSLLVMGALD